MKNNHSSYILSYINMLSAKLSELRGLIDGSPRSGALEVEAKFGVYNERGFNSGVPFVHYDRLFTLLSQSASVQHSEQESHVAQMDGYRRVTTGDIVNYQLKTRVAEVDLPEYDIRVSVSTEEELPGPPPNFRPTVMRDRTRHMFTLPNNLARVDMTHVMMNDEDRVMRPRYEVEIEFLGAPDQLDKFSEDIQRVFKWLNGTYQVYTTMTKRTLNQDIARILGGSMPGLIDKGVLVEARNIKRRDLVFGGVVGNPKTNYLVTFKADGLRKLLVFHTTGIWLVFPPYDFNLVISGAVNNEGLKKLLAALNGTVLDGELVKPAIASPVMYSYYAFDCLSFRGNNAIQNSSYADRRKKVDEVARVITGNTISIAAKETHELNTPDDFFRVIKSMLDRRGTLPYLDDGLIFTPGQTPYNNYSQHVSLHRRVLTSQPDICKWKPTSDLTIDFSIKVVEEGKLELYSYDDETNKLVPFKGSLINPVTSDMIDHYNELTIGKPTNTIVEYEWKDNMFRPRRIRYDKSGPNRLSIALDNWDDIRKPISEQEISGENLAMTFSYHNRIKRDLFSKLAPGSNILDIGSGRGGDISKWKGLNGKVVAVEPNYINRAELEKRIELYGVKDRIRVVPSGGENTAAITAAVREFIPGGKVDAVTLMLSLSFFWETPASLNALVETIRSTLKPNGIVLFLTIDGDVVQDMFVGTDELQLVTAKMKIYPPNPPYGRPIDFILPDTIVGEQREYLVHLKDLSEKLGPLGFNLAEKKRADQEKLLSPENMRFSSMYSYGYYQGGGAVAAAENVPAPVPVPAPPAPSVCHKKYIPENQRLRPQSVSARGGDDNSLPIRCSWSNDLYRIATIGDGNCFVHSLLKSFYRPYQENGDYRYRVDMAKKIRRDLALILTEENPDYPGHTYWSTTGNGALPRLTMQEVLDPNIIEAYNVDYSVAGIQRLLNSNRFLGNETYSLVADVFNLDVYILQATADELYPQTNTLYSHPANRPRNAVIIMGDGNHFEVIALRTPTGLQTIFPPGDPFLQTLNGVFKEVNACDNQGVYDPDETFIKDVTDTFLVDGGQIPWASIEEIFREDDYFRLDMERLFPTV
jgi:SAM-dependent methyltransferase